jgi:spoIIIJ-associated protein
MSSSDRRIIHSALSESPDLLTESIGEDPERRIVIKLKK